MCLLCSDTHTPMSISDSTGHDASDSYQRVYVDPRVDAADSRQHQYQHQHVTLHGQHLTAHQRPERVSATSALYSASSHFHPIIIIIIIISSSSSSSSSDADTSQWHWTHQRLRQTLECNRWVLCDYLPSCLFHAAEHSAVSQSLIADFTYCRTCKRLSVGVTDVTGGSLSDVSCSQRDVLARCVTVISPYLYPCTIQYAIIASGLSARCLHIATTQY